MADLNLFEMPIGWAPDEDHINMPPNYEYLAWRIGRNQAAGKEIWVIQQVVEAPTAPLADLLPGATHELPFANSTTSYGYTKAVAPFEPDTVIKGKINDQVGYAIEERLI